MLYYNLVMFAYKINCENVSKKIDGKVKFAKKYKINIIIKMIRIYFNTFLS